MAAVHPSAVLEGDVVLGEGVTVGPHCTLIGPLVVGARTKVHPGCVIGTEAEHRTKGPVGTIRIGSDTVLRELTVVQRGTGDRETTIGDRCYVMDHGHVAHDCLLEDGVTMAPNVVLAGHTRILRGATVGVGVVLHQFSTIGAYAMLGMGAVITRDVPPFCLVTGNPARFRRLNTYPLAALGLQERDLRLERGGLSSEQPLVVECLRAFAEHSRREKLALARVSD